MSLQVGLRAGFILAELGELGGVGACFVPPDCEILVSISDESIFFSDCLC